MLEQEAVVCLIMALKVDRDFPSKIGSIVDSILPVVGGSENSHTSSTGGGEQGDTVRPAT
jgi:hypothetical protein